MDIHQSNNGSDDLDELMISFPNHKKQGFLKKSHEDASNVEVKITLKGFDRPKGLDVIIEGYDKALRAQVPG